MNQRVVDVRVILDFVLRMRDAVTSGVSEMRGDAMNSEEGEGADTRYDGNEAG